MPEFMCDETTGAPVAESEGTEGSDANGEVLYSVCPECGDKTVEGMNTVCRECDVELVPETAAKKKKKSK